MDPDRGPRMESLVLSTLALAAAHGPGPGFGFGWWFPLVFLFWIGIIALIFALVGRRWRRSGGPQGYWQQAAATRDAESALATRYANGEIDETEYRSRLDVLRSTRPQPGK